jgi:16S rRNA processing protein RimM
VTVYDLSGNPDRFREGSELFLFPPENGESYVIESSWLHQDRLILKFRGVDTMTAAEGLRDREARIPASWRPPAPEGESYQSDLIGCRLVEKATGEDLGIVTACEEFGGPMLLVVKRKGGKGEMMVPFVPVICVEVDTAARRIVAVLPEGLKEL